MKLSCRMMSLRCHSERLRPRPHARAPFSILKPYTAGSLSIYHFDLYRVSDPEELELMGIRDYFDGSSVCLVEWPDRGDGLISPPDVTVRISYSGSARKAEAESSTPLGDQIISGWNK